MGSNPPYIKPFEKEDTISAGFFGSQGGVSKGLYESLNCGLGSDDVKENVLENSRCIAAALELDPENLLSLYQIHSANCLVVEQPWDQENRPQADAMVTKNTGLGLSILTADCAPVLFHAKDTEGKPVIGAAHAGWRGAFEGILQETVKAMKNLGARKETFKAAIGPCIAQSSYEVNQDFYQRFLNQEESYDLFFKNGLKENHYHFDLPGFCAYALSNAGLKNVKLIDRDTYTLKNEYYSFRRTTHEGKSDYGRQLSVIKIRPSED